MDRRKPPHGSRLPGEEEPRERELDALRADLRTAQGELARAREEIAGMESSASWRITRPFRRWRSSYLKRRAAVARWLSRGGTPPPENVAAAGWLPAPAPAARGPRSAPGPVPRVIAWYLPQFHPIRENDAWWGKGFTEWRNVARARPLFAGHHQPQLPADLGFYDLRLPEVRAEQAELARRHGIHGFAYHYYWFNGRRVLETPITSMLRSGEPDFPFCLSWANENWTRRWDGRDSEILLRQEHDLASDVRFLRDVMPFLKDRRYITLEGKPLLIVYRADLLRNAAETAAAWRDEARRAGLPGLHLCAVEFLVHDPVPLGFDALIEFPPHELAAPPVDAAATPGLAADFRGRVLDYAAGVRRASAPAGKPFAYHRGVMPGWDNTARRGKGATVFHGATPELYGLWLRQLAEEARHTATGGEHFLFVNAWNEWAEGAHLEPDQWSGLAWLEATRDALAAADGAAEPPARPPDLARAGPATPGSPRRPAREAKTPVRWGFPERGRFGDGARRPMLLVSHDAARAGAQLVLLRLVERLAAHDRVEPWVLLRQGGVLEPEFRRLAPTLRLDQVGRGLSLRQAAERAVADFERRSPLLALCNTVVSSDVAEICDAHGIPVLSHVHELPTSISVLGEETLERVVRHSRRTVVVSEFVRAELCRTYGIAPEKLLVLHNGVGDGFGAPGLRERARPELLRQLGFPASSFLVLGCGSIHPRKGPDVFVQVAIEASRLSGADRLRFLWIGQDQSGPTLREWCEHDVGSAGLRGRVVFGGEREEPAPVFAAADAFALTSREDPFPTVSLEAMASGLPVVAFSGAGGAPEAFQGGAGIAVPYLDAGEMARHLVKLAGDPAGAAEIGRRARQRIADRHSYERFFAEFMGLVEREFPP